MSIIINNMEYDNNLKYLSELLKGPSEDFYLIVCITLDRKAPFFKTVKGQDIFATIFENDSSNDYYIFNKLVESFGIKLLYIIPVTREITKIRTQEYIFLNKVCPAYGNDHRDYLFLEKKIDNPDTVV